MPAADNSRENPSLTLDQKLQGNAPDPTRHRKGSRRSPPSHVIHTVHRIRGQAGQDPTNFLNRVCSRAGPGTIRSTSLKAQRFHVTTGAPPKGHAT
jgi:hypothetical protein